MPPSFHIICQLFLCVRACTFVKSRISSARWLFIRCQNLQTSQIAPA